MLGIIKAPGGSAGGYRRERHKAVRAIVAEIYSPPRVKAATKLLPELRIIPGFALDLTTNDDDGRPWNFDEAEMRERARRKMREQKPLLLVGSPMCTAFSTWQHVSNAFRCPIRVAAELRDATRHLAFCAELYREQARNGRYFLFFTRLIIV